MADACIGDLPTGAQIKAAQSGAQARRCSQRPKAVVGEVAAAAQLQTFEAGTGGGESGDNFVRDPFAHGEID